MDRLETASHILTIQNMKVGDVHIIPNQNTSGAGFYRSMYMWLGRRGYPFRVKCKTVGKDLHVEKVE